MLIVRDFVAHMANEVVKRLVEGGQIETKGAAAVANRVRQRMLEELTVEDRLNDEVRQILIDHQDEMRRTSVSYQEMYKKVKQQLARDRKLILSGDVQEGEAATGEGPQADPSLDDFAIVATWASACAEVSSSASCSHWRVHKRNLRNDAPHPRKNRTALAPDH